MLTVYSYSVNVKYSDRGTVFKIWALHATALLLKIIYLFIHFDQLHSGILNKEYLYKNSYNSYMVLKYVCLSLWLKPQSYYE